MPMLGFRDPLVRVRAVKDLLLTSVKTPRTICFRILNRKMTTSAGRHAKAAYWLWEL